MANNIFNPDNALGIKIKDLSRKELCELASKLCTLIKEEAGPGGFRGGVYPENISIDAEGELGLGKAKKSDWGESELGFLAPELFWKGEKSSAADVYSIGMLLYYAANGGKLPFTQSGEDKAAAGEAQQRRMNGEVFKAPKAAGSRLGEIINKATAFNVHERYQSMDELKAVLDSCVKNLYLKGVPSAESIFNKNDDDLSAVERMMVSIIEKEDAEPEKPVSEPEEAAATEESAAEEDVRIYEAEQAPAEESAAEASEEEEKPAEQAFVPVLHEEKNPELAPVSVERQPVAVPAVQYGKSMERERKINEQLKKRKRRPVIAILILCVLLVIAAIVVNAINKDSHGGPNGGNNRYEDEYVDFTVPPTPTVAPTEEPQPTEEPVEQLPVESTYELIIEDLSWTAARDKCLEKGGHLAVVTSQEELDKIIAMAEEKGIKKLWLGCHRIDGTLVWETTEDVTFYKWANGEPSEYDWGDNVPEDYLLLWYHNGWFYNDSRNDPVADYPEMYSGQLAYVCEYDGR